METGELVRFRYRGRIVEGEIIEEVTDLLHPNSYKVRYENRVIRVMPSEVVK